MHDLGVDGGRVLKLIRSRQIRDGGLDQYDSGEGQVSGFCEIGDELLGPIQRGELLD